MLDSDWDQNRNPGVVTIGIVEIGLVSSLGVLRLGDRKCVGSVVTLVASWSSVMMAYCCTNWSSELT